MLATMMSHATATATAPCRRDHVASFSFSSSQRYHHHHQWKKNCVQFHHRRRRHRTCNATEIVAGRFPDERTYIMVKCVRASFAPYVSSTSSFSFSSSWSWSWSWSSSSSSSSFSSSLRAGKDARIISYYYPKKEVCLFVFVREKDDEIERRLTDEL